MENKIKLALICGGMSSEREISLLTGSQIYENLDNSKYDIVVIDSANMLGSRANRAKYESNLEAVSDKAKRFAESATGTLADVASCDVAFIALHGKYGEDGTIQGYLELMGVPYTCSHVMTSAICIDKAMSKKILSASGLTVAKSIDFNAVNNGWDRKEIREKVGMLGYPVMVKPSRQGSSCGMVKVERPEELVGAIERALEFDSFIVIEKFVAGMEMSVSVVDFDGVFALPIAEILPASGAYDYYSKYTPGATREIIPARLSDADTKKAMADAVAAYKAVGCSGVARVDIIFDGKDMYILELNTIPGMTRTSLLPQCAKAYGLEFPELLDKIIERAIMSGDLIEKKR